MFVCHMKRVWIVLGNGVGGKDLLCSTEARPLSLPPPFPHGPPRPPPSFHLGKNFANLLLITSTTSTMGIMTDSAELLIAIFVWVEKAKLGGKRMVKLGRVYSRVHCVHNL